MKNADVYLLMKTAIDNVFKPSKEQLNENYSKYCTLLMGGFFFRKHWSGYTYKYEGISLINVPYEYRVTDEEIEKLRSYAGPYGKALYHIRKIKESA